MLPGLKSAIAGLSNPTAPGVVAANSGNSTSASVSWPAGRQVGSVVYVLISSKGGSAPATPSGFTSIASTASANSYRFAKRTIDGTESGNITSTVSLEVWGIQLVEIVNPGAQTVSSINSGGGTTLPYNTINPGVSENYLWVTIGFTTGSGSVPLSSGYTSLLSASGARIQYKISAASSESPGSVTVASTQPHMSVGIGTVIQ